MYNYGLKVLFFITLKMLFHHLLSSMVSEGISTVTQIVWIGFFVRFVLFWVFSCLGLTTFLDTVIYVFHQIQEIFRQYFFKFFLCVFFSCTCHSPIFWYFSNKNGRPFDIAPQEPEALFIFKTLLSLCHPNLMFCIDVSLSSVTLSSIISTLVNLIQPIFYFKCCISSFSTLYGIFLSFLFLLRSFTPFI